MNYKLEKFWNIIVFTSSSFCFFMNYKLEKFWNIRSKRCGNRRKKWTINLKSFEIQEAEP